MNNITSSIFFGGWSLGGIGSEMIGTMVRSYLASTSVCPISREQKQRDSSPYYFGASGGVVPLSAPWQYRVDYNYWNKTGDSKGDGLVMVIPIRGVLTKESQPSGSGGMDDIASAVEWAYGQEMIVGVVLDIFSPGGSVYGTAGLSAVIGRNEKPVVSFINDLAASAAYWVASGSEYIFISGGTARAGSIGAYLSFIDDRTWQENEGVKVIEVYADESDLKNSGIREYLSEGKLDILRAEVGQYASAFIADVKRGRGDRLKWESNDAIFRGELFEGKTARRIGLVDGIGSLSDAVAEAFRRGKRKKKMADSVVGQ